MSRTWGRLRFAHIGPNPPPACPLLQGVAPPVVQLPDCLQGVDDDEWGEGDQGADQGAAGLGGDGSATLLEEWDLFDALDEALWGGSSLLDPGCWEAGVPGSRAAGTAAAAAAAEGLEPPPKRARLGGACDGSATSLSHCPPPSTPTFFSPQPSATSFIPAHSVQHTSATATTSPDAAAQCRRAGPPVITTGDRWVPGARASRRLLGT